MYVADAMGSAYSSKQCGYTNYHAELACAKCGSGRMVWYIPIQQNATFSSLLRVTNPECLTLIGSNQHLVVREVEPGYGGTCMVGICLVIR